MSAPQIPIGQMADVDERLEMPPCIVDAPATLFGLTQGTMMVGRMRELSPSGCLILLPKNPFRTASAAVECAFSIRGVGFRLGGIVGSVENNLAGVYFNTMSSRSRDDLIEVLCEVTLENNAKLVAQGIAVVETEDSDPEPDASAIATILAEEAARTGAQPKPNAVAWNPFAGMANAPKQNWLQSKSGSPSAPISAVAPASAQVRDMAAGKALPAAAVAAPTPALPTPVPPTLALQTPAPQTPAPPTPAAGTPSAAPSKGGRDRRTTQRCDVDTSALIDLINVGAKIQGQIMDLSVGGCRIKTPEKFPVGIYTRVETEFQVHGLAFRLGGVVQAIHNHNMVGIRFLDMSQRKKEQVAELVTEILASDGGQ